MLHNCTSLKEFRTKTSDCSFLFSALQMKPIYHCFVSPLPTIYYLSPSLRHTRHVKRGEWEKSSNAKYRPLIKRVRQNVKWHHRAACKAQAEGSIPRYVFQIYYNYVANNLSTKFPQCFFNTVYKRVQTLQPKRKKEALNLDIFN